MGKHVPLPTDPIAKAAEKKRRFAAYRKAWKARTKAAWRQKKIAEARARRDLEQACIRAHVDLCCDPKDMTLKQLKAALEFVACTLTHPRL
jgi:predicted CoA-binding protein